MRIVCISDTHNKHKNIILPEGDMLIHAGDISVMGTIQEIEDFLNWMKNLPYKYKVLIAGNHDFAFENKKDQIIIPKEIFYLENSLVKIENLKIWGSPISTPYFDWAFMWDIEKRKALYDTIPNDVDIIISHGPIFDILDTTSRKTKAGCPILREKVFLIKPKYFISGHIHESYGIMESKGITFINAAILNRQREIANKPVIIEI